MAAPKQAAQPYRSPEGTYTRVRNSVLEDPALSMAARGLAAYLASKPDGWQIIEKQLKQAFPPDSAYAIRKALKELRAAGYVGTELIKDASTGRITARVSRLRTARLTYTRGKPAHVHVQPYAQEGTKDESAHVTPKTPADIMELTCGNEASSQVAPIMTSDHGMVSRTLVTTDRARNYSQEQSEAQRGRDEFLRALTGDESLTSAPDGDDFPFPFIEIQPGSRRVIEPTASKPSAALEVAPRRAAPGRVQIPDAPALSATDAALRTQVTREQRQEAAQRADLDRPARVLLPGSEAAWQGVLDAMILCPECGWDRAHSPSCPAVAPGESRSAPVVETTLEVGRSDGSAPAHDGATALG